MRIVIDMQGAQSESRFRGIGRYTMSLAKAIAQNRGNNEIILALSGLFPDTIESIRKTFDNILPQTNIRTWHAPGPVRDCVSGNSWRRKVAEGIREAFLSSLNPDVVQISSLFEGYVDDAVTSIGVFSSHCPTAVILYDLIPLLQEDTYLKPNPVYSSYYHRKIESLKRARMLLAISESAALEARSQLKFSNDQIVNIFSACDSIFRPIEISNIEKHKLFNHFQITQPFIMYSGGADERKNLKRLIRAYAHLPKSLYETHQLVLVGKINCNEMTELQQLAKSINLSKDRLLFTGYISDEVLAQIYNLCTVFVLPSLHEGFGLTALEAMSCGAAVIGANVTSIPEVLNCKDALFDPYDEAAITQKLAQILDSVEFRKELRLHGLRQSRMFSWDHCAKMAIAAYEKLYANKSERRAIATPNHRPKLAYVSPLPPEQTGIANYSAEFIPALTKYYDIVAVVNQESVTDEWVHSNCPIRDVQWLRENAHNLDRVLYHIGNSPFHQHMLSLIIDIPGTVVLHDFFLSSMLGYLEENGVGQNSWAKSLYLSHGYPATKERYHSDNSYDVKVKYPANFDVLQCAKGIIVHSEYSRSLATEWYGAVFDNDWKVVPHPRKFIAQRDRAQSRAALGLGMHDFVVCCFGGMDPSKLNHLLLDAWIHSNLAKDKNCVLIFVGAKHGGKYGALLNKILNSSDSDKGVRMTGWVDMSTFWTYLSATDIAVQLRSTSRGETSGTVLDCMNHGVPTIVNANGAMAELPFDAVWMLPENFEVRQLTEALEHLRQDRERCKLLGKRSQEYIQNRHSPSNCAQQFAEAIENFHTASLCDTHALLDFIINLDSHQPTDDECKSLSQSIAQSFPLKQPAKKILVDISATCRTYLKTGIERVVSALVKGLIEGPLEGYRVEPVYLCDRGGFWHYRYATMYTLELLKCPTNGFHDEVVEPINGDILLCVDLSGQMLIDAEAQGLLKFYRNTGVSIHFIVYDLLPVKMPQFFPPGADISHNNWLQIVAKSEGAICISKVVAEELSEWIEENGVSSERTFKIDWFHLGADFNNFPFIEGFNDTPQWAIDQFKTRPTFIMVGTIEPRKGYTQVIEGFSHLWNKGLDVNLVIVGKEGWKGIPEELRRDIPQIIERIVTHPELDNHLFWLDSVTDTNLEELYSTSTCLIAASYGEGYGLPLIEAAQHKLPILARDIPVFREVAGEYAFYFKGKSPESIAQAVTEWLTLLSADKHPKSTSMPWSTWKASAAQLLQRILSKDPQTAMKIG
ncbi:glycosyltransferase [Desulfatitalea alkaliphila]|uniref:Glycosyltransferase n=1 Tax=Desulfatitalea alkaliphila TaxID=2929485 RepID=A0AA41R588_9BACT|nr:glycosyltransferase [Desulfatitalea alkaliphila]MCJ8501250.1 glycosyltransferase [Desulfatitalea alkaliphila]